MLSYKMCVYLLVFCCCSLNANDLNLNVINFSVDEVKFLIPSDVNFSVRNTDTSDTPKIFIRLSSEFIKKYNLPRLLQGVVITPYLKKYKNKIQNEIKGFDYIETLQTNSEYTSGCSYKTVNGAISLHLYTLNNIVTIVGPIVFVNKILNLKKYCDIVLAKP